MKLKVTYTVEFRPAARRDMRKLSRDVQMRIAARIEALTAEPRPYGSEKLKGSDSLYRVRASDYRIIYEIRDTALVVVIVDVGHRREVYR